MTADAIGDAIGDEIEQLTALVDSLGGHDLSALDDAALHDVTIQLHRLHDRLGLVAGHALSRGSGGMWASDQSRTSTGRLSGR